MLVAKALVVDDEPLCLQVVSRLLSDEGVEVFPATRPHQALEIIRNNPTFALVLSDVVMPEMHGTELVREVARISPETALILMSGGPVEPARVPDGVPLIHKPFSKGELLSTIRAALERRPPSEPRRPLGSNG